MEISPQQITLKSHTKNVQHNSFSLMKALQLNVQILGMEIITEMNL